VSVRAGDPNASTTIRICRPRWPRADRRRLGHWPETAFEEITMPPASPGCDASPSGLLARREGSTYCEQSRAVDRTDLCYLGPRYACGTRRVASVPSASVQPPSRIRGWTPSAHSCFWQAMSHHSSPPPRFPWMAAYPSAQRDFLSGGSLDDRAANAKFSCFTCSESSLRLCAMSSNSW
jgi:hypothetical protein